MEASSCRHHGGRKEGPLAASLASLIFYLNHHHLESLLPLPLHILPHHSIPPPVLRFCAHQLSRTSLDENLYLPPFLFLLHFQVRLALLQLQQAAAAAPSISEPHPIHLCPRSLQGQWKAFSVLFSSTLLSFAGSDCRQLAVNRQPSTGFHGFPRLRQSSSPTRPCLIFILSVASFDFIPSHPHKLTHHKQSRFLFDTRHNG